MELRSPRHDPFSDLELARDEFRKNGYILDFSVTDEQHCKDEKGRLYSSEDLVINEVRRIIDKKVNADSVMVHAIAAKDGSKGLLVTHYPPDEDETGVTDQFLLNVDKNDETKPMY